MQVTATTRSGRPKTGTSMSPKLGIVQNQAVPGRSNPVSLGEHEHDAESDIDPRPVPPMANTGTRMQNRATAGGQPRR